jgi:hypothetical protein
MRPQIHREFDNLPDHQGGVTRRAPDVHHFYIRIVSGYFAISIGNGVLVFVGGLKDDGLFDPEKTREFSHGVTRADPVPNRLILDVPVEISS